LALLFLAIALAACNRSPRPLTTDSPVELARFTRGNNALALDLYERARHAPGNVAISPLAISNALAMLWAGARGETAAQIQRVLHAEGTADKALDTAGQIARNLGDPGRKFTFQAASRLFVEKGRASEPAQLAQLGTMTEPLDFILASEPSRRHINDWVAGQTQNHIRDLLPAGAVTPLTTLVVAGALYFHGDWTTRFSADETRRQPFYRTPTDEKDVPTMHQEGSFRIAVTDGVGVLELPYEGGELAMTVVVPWGTEDLAAVEARASPAALDRWSLALRPEKTTISLPRFEMNARFPLGESLKALGMAHAFDHERADFTGIVAKGSSLTEIYHEVYVKVDEAGTEAAAGTGSSLYKAGPPPFVVDHPFLFFIREVRSGLILFMGRVSDPTGGT
jgi:serpin B